MEYLWNSSNLPGCMEYLRNTNYTGDITGVVGVVVVFCAIVG